MKYEITFLEILTSLFSKEILIEKGKILYSDKSLISFDVLDGKVTFNIFDLKRKGIIKITNYDASVKSSD